MYMHIMFLIDDKHQFKKSDFYQEEDTSLSARELLCNTLAQTTTASASSTAKMTSSSSSSSISASYKKRRILFTREQTHELQKVFQCQQYLTVPQRDYLSRKINLSPTQVCLSFYNMNLENFRRISIMKHFNNTLFVRLLS